VGQGRHHGLELSREVLWRFERVGEVDADPLVALESITRLVQLESDLEVCDRIGGHE
jgi:hypothetical protein